MTIAPHAATVTVRPIALPTDGAAALALFRAGMHHQQWALTTGIVTRSALGVGCQAAAFVLFSALAPPQIGLTASLAITAAAFAALLAAAYATAHINIAAYVAQCEDMTDMVRAYGAAAQPRWKFWVAERPSLSSDTASGTSGCAAAVIVGTIAVQARPGNVVEIHRVSTLLSERRGGIARVLMHQLEAWAAADGVGKIILSTSTSQPAALALYDREGYTEVRRAPISPFLCGLEGVGLGWLLPGVQEVWFEKALAGRTRGEAEATKKHR